MSTLRFLVLTLFISSLACNQASNIQNLKGLKESKPSTKIIEGENILERSETSINRKKNDKSSRYLAVKGAILTTRYASLEELKSDIKIEYFNGNFKKNKVRLTHNSNGQKVISELKTGVCEKDFQSARIGSFGDKLWLLWRSPYAIANRKTLTKIYHLTRRKNETYGSGDVAFFDLAEKTVHHIISDDLVFIRPQDLTEKGYLNTFNHITAQAIMTSIFSEEIADFIADIHERSHLPELITGKFSEAQRSDLLNGPVDNYVDIINNEWGQELGKLLRGKYEINQNTFWTPELLSEYLNDLQQYYSWVFQIGFHPFRPTDEVVVRFSDKINTVMKTL